MAILFIESYDEEMYRNDGVPSVLFFDPLLISGDKNIDQIKKEINFFTFENSIQMEKMTLVAKRCQYVYITYSADQLPPWCCSALLAALLYRSQKNQPPPEFLVGFSMDLKKKPPYSDKGKIKKKAHDFLLDIVPSEIYTLNSHPELHKVFTQNVSTFFFGEKDDF